VTDDAPDEEVGQQLGQINIAQVVLLYLLQ